MNVSCYYTCAKFIDRIVLDEEREHEMKTNGGVEIRH
jgi:hypothetical protein